MSLQNLYDSHYQRLPSRLSCRSLTKCPCVARERRKQRFTEMETVIDDLNAQLQALKGVQSQNEELKVRPCPAPACPLRTCTSWVHALFALGYLPAMVHTTGWRA